MNHVRITLQCRLYNLSRKSFVEASSVAVIIPTWNERTNIGTLLGRLSEILADHDYRLVVVDDGSPDGTAGAVKEVQRQDPRVVLVERQGKLGLASAVLKGAEASKSKVAVMMDADLSHDPEIVPELVEKIQGGYDVAIGSRYVPGGRLVGWPWHRRLMSWAATCFARVLLWPGAKDPMSGFAAFKRDLLLDPPTRYSAKGFKLLLEILVTRAPLKVAEVPIAFAQREKGVSKMGSGELLEFAILCLKLMAWKLSRPFKRQGT
jgi:dolichol-phosphate mannosyltransferase